MTALPVSVADLEARMRAVSKQFDKSVERKAKGPEFINFTKPGKYIVRVLPSRNYPVDVRWFRKLGRHFIINVVTPDKQGVVRTAKVPQRFIKFLRTFQDMVNQLFCDPTHGNLIAFEAFPAANGFGNDYKIIKQQPMPTTWAGDQIPDLDELLKAAIDDIKPVSAFSGNLVAPLAGATPATNAFSVRAYPAKAPDPSTKASGVNDPFAAFANWVPTPPPAAHAAAASTPASGISDADAKALEAKLLAMVGG
jgi:hypothetical protein